MVNVTSEVSVHFITGNILIQKWEAFYGTPCICEIENKENMGRVCITEVYDDHIRQYQSLTFLTDFY